MSRKIAKQTFQVKHGNQQRTDASCGGRKLVQVSENFLFGKELDRVSSFVKHAIQSQNNDVVTHTRSSNFALGEVDEYRGRELKFGFVQYE